MKKKFVAGLLVLLAAFVVGGVYVVVAIESAASRLDELVRLHQVEILREHYLIQVKRVQSDLALRNTRFSRNFDTVVTDVVNMGRAVDGCFGCHHSPAGESRLRELKDETERYEQALSRVLTLRANSSRLAEEEDNAFRRGEALMGKVRDMIAMTSGRLGERMQRSLDRIRSTRYVLYALLGLGPLLAVGTAYTYLRGIGGSVTVLREATGKLKGGDFDHRVAGLRGELGELAADFNEMAGTLREQMRTIRRTEQMVMLAELAAGLAHEIGKPLAGIKAAVNDLAREPRLSAEDRETVVRVIEEIGWLETLLRTFLNFAKPQKSAGAEVNVNNLLESTLAFCLKHGFPGSPARDDVRIVKEFCPLPAMTADHRQLQQLFLNLFLNAVDAMPGGGVLGVRTSLGEGPGTIRVEISNTGGRNDAGAKGAGLSLSIANLLVERQGGTIAAVTIPDGGTVLTVRLPVRPPGEPPAS
ncbi:MAG: ATP-binding protein [Deltaproteobacteria bacterium]